ncbi:hypothetical protein [Cohnella silvisoli]|uniref:Tetratricopeptide repeat protein n=1 Tax=Cohnella silvisoli TaxID=2873699 RepID=A0ABV1L344_9BACL|nr:hypothetical protein [Cohnella silvisoli]MCD9026089.1 hypothetical protein [Cohnella silvisoli]
MKNFQSKLIVVAISLILCLSLMGCTESKEKKIEKLKEEATTFISSNNYDDAMLKYDEILALDDSPIYADEKTNIQILKYRKSADEALKNGEIKKAIETYEKILVIKEVDDVKSILSDIKEEQEAAIQVQAFYDELYNIQKDRLRSGIKVKPTDMEYIIKDLRRLTEDFERIDDSKDTDIARHIKSVKESLHYSLYKIQVDSKLHDDSGLSEAFGELDSEMKMVNTLAVANTRNSLNESIDGIIAMPIPEKYK